MNQNEVGGGDTHSTNIEDIRELSEVPQLEECDTSCSGVINQKCSDNIDNNGNTKEVEVAMDVESSHGEFGNDENESSPLETDHHVKGLHTIDVPTLKLMPLEETMESVDTQKDILKSILKTTKKCDKRVSFPSDDEELVTSENACVDLSWYGVTSHTAEEIINEYRNACSKVKTVILDSVLNQLKDISENDNYTATLNLSNITVTGDVIDTLEVIFKMVTFRTIYISIGRCSTSTAMDIFDIINYYDPVIELIISNTADETTIWQNLSSAILKSNTLSSLSFREMKIEDYSLRILFEGINYCYCLKTLRFVGCELSRAPAFMLANHLLDNAYLQELHLCFVNLYSKEADILAKFLAANSSLRVLNLSNNKIGDRGLKAIAKALSEQSSRGIGVMVLILVNNRLTECSASTLEYIIFSSCLLYTINLGLNNLTDTVISNIQNALSCTKTLKALGLQSTLLTCSGLRQLTEACINNTSLRRINLRGNKAIQPEALNELADVIHRTTLCHIDLDDSNRSCNNPQQYVEVVNKIRNLVVINKNIWEESYYVRQAYLNCEPEYVPQIVEHSVTTRAKLRSSKNRFQVVTVEETKTSSQSGSGRFTVVSVSASTDKATTDFCEIGSATTQNVNVEDLNLVGANETTGKDIQPNNRNDSENIAVNTSPLAAQDITLLEKRENDKNPDLASGYSTIET